MILMYHHVAPPDVVPTKWDYIEGWDDRVSPEAFENHLIALTKKGGHFTAMSEMVDNIHKRGVEDPKGVALTFDDGWVDNHAYALPILKKHCVPATFFVTSGHLQSGTEDPRKMSLPQLKELLHAGMTIGGHSRSHPDLTRLPPGEARIEIEGCKDDLEQSLGVNIRFFAYPGGAFNRDVARLVREAGFLAACSSLGPNRNDASSLFWLYRDLLSESMISYHDRYRLSPLARRLLSFRVRRRLSQTLSAN